MEYKNRICSGYLPSPGSILGDSSPSTNLIDRQFLPEHHSNVRRWIFCSVSFNFKTASAIFFSVYRSHKCEDIYTYFHASLRFDMMEKRTGASNFLLIFLLKNARRSRANNKREARQS